MALQPKNEPTEEIDTPIELECYKIKARQQTIWMVFKFVVLVFAIIGSTVLGFLYDGNYLTYTYIFYGVLITFAIGEKVDLTQLSEIIKK